MIFKFIKSFILEKLSVFFLSSSEYNSAYKNGNTSITYRSIQFYIQGFGQAISKYCSVLFTDKKSKYSVGLERVLAKLLFTSNSNIHISY